MNKQAGGCPSRWHADAIDELADKIAERVSDQLLEKGEAIEPRSFLSDDQDALGGLALKIAEALNNRTHQKEKEIRDRTGMAELIGVSVPTIDRLVSDGRIPSFTIGNRRLFDVSAVIAELTKNCPSRM